MRVLYTTAWYPNRKVAGDGVFIQKHAHAIARLNQLAVLMVQTDESKHDLSIEICATRQSDLDEVLVYVPKTRFEIPVLTGLIRLYWLMAGYLKGYFYIKKHYWQGQRPEVCHVNVLTRAAGLPWLLRKVYGIPYIITEHWTRYARPDSYPDSSMQLRLGRLFVRDASYVCPVSLNLELSMKKWKLENKHYTRVGNVVDTDVFTLPSAVVGSREVTRFVHVSWMRDETKNISGILRVLSRLKSKHQNFHLRLIGEGNDKERLHAYAKELGLVPGYVTFVEAKKGEALAEELRNSDAMLMFSHHENQPVSVLEALACGLPVIASTAGSLPAMLARNRGITVKPGDEDELLSVIDGFLTLRSQLTETQLADPTLAIQRREYVVSQHSPEVIGRQFDALYRASRATTC